MAAVHNLRGKPAARRSSSPAEIRNGYAELLGRARCERLEEGGLRVDLEPYGYLWLRMREPQEGDEALPAPPDRRP